VENIPPIPLPYGETLALRVPAQKIGITNKPQPIRLQIQGLFSRLENLATLEETVIVGRLPKTKYCFKILSYCRKDKLCNVKLLECSTRNRQISRSRDWGNTLTPCCAGQVLRILAVRDSGVGVYFAKSPGASLKNRLVFSDPSCRGLVFTVQG